MSHPHVFRVTRATNFVAKWGIEPQIIRMKGERFSHCATDLAPYSVGDFRICNNEIECMSLELHLSEGESYVIMQV